MGEANKAPKRDGTDQGILVLKNTCMWFREPVTEMDLERNAVREAELRRKQEVRKEALTAHDKEIWNREMQVSFLLLKPKMWNPDQIQIRIWIEIYKLDPDPHQFADVKPEWYGI